MKRALFAALVMIVSLAGCTKDPNKVVIGPVNGTLRNMTGLDGCGWMIQLDANGRKLEPVNLHKFNMTLSEGLKVKVVFTEHAGYSICMAGPMVNLISIRAD
jgi:nitrous oxide reductase accessory protein NosL